MKEQHLGIIGGGQLGMLLVQAAIEFPVKVSVYDPNPQCSAASFTDSFTQGDFDDESAILEFAKNCDAVIFETEKTSITALLKLQEQGKTVLSSPEDLQWIQNKLTQRKHLQDAGFPVPQFTEIKAQDIHAYSGPFPIVQKWQTGGYDGLGVHIHQDQESLSRAPEKDSVFEEMVDIKMELSVLVARDHDGNVVTYPATEMVFTEANLVDYLIAPARISEETAQQAQELCERIAEEFNFHGIYAIELFLDQDNNILVNEIAPRPHNSGHHTVYANVTSQYQQQVRIALGLPLGATTQLTTAVLLNLIADNSSGETKYQGLKEVYQIPNTQFVIYGKTTVRPNRKMGHVIILENDVADALQKIQKIRQTLTITSYDN